MDRVGYVLIVHVIDFPDEHLVRRFSRIYFI